MNKTIPVEEFIVARDQVLVLDVRRKEDFETGEQIVSGSIWKDPACMDEWVSTLPTDQPIVIYCVRGGGVSNSVVDRLISSGRDARYVEGGIVALQGNSSILVNR